AVKKFGVVGYHKIFENKKPQINADERRFMIAYFTIYNNLTPKDFTLTHSGSVKLSVVLVCWNACQKSVVIGKRV
ncbi:MAG: hypothetical protein O8C61_09240, partial [Candidatus Methanoperedens sp.]|nr:hypothetical protein [Candidatus Methanoperedens sp.]